MQPSLTKIHSVIQKKWLMKFSRSVILKTYVCTNGYACVHQWECFFFFYLFLYFANLKDIDEILMQGCFITGDNHVTCVHMSKPDVATLSYRRSHCWLQKER